MKKLVAICCSIVLSMLVVPVLGFSASILDSESGQTPGYVAPSDVDMQAVTPYVAPANVFVPASSKAIASDAGKFAHTNYVIKNVSGIQPQSLTDLSFPEPMAVLPDNTFSEYPASLACVYKMGPTYTGCLTGVNNAAYNAVGGSRAIAIVIAYDNPTVKADLDFFRSWFGLPVAKWKEVKVTTAVNASASCSTVPFNSGWALESAMDTQWSGAMAPNARIILVEACDNSFTQLGLAEVEAIKQVNLYGGGQVSNSWGGGEYSGETAWDATFRLNWTSGKPVSFFFSAGDSGLGAQYPSSSPWVVSAGGTTINRDASQNFVSESCWSGSGGGTSTYELWSSTFSAGNGPWTAFQVPLFNATVGASPRKTPDMAADADPNSGAWVRYNGAWYVVGGTSLAAPLLAGIVNNSNNQLGIAPRLGGVFTNDENNLLYSQLLTYKEYKNNFYDVTTGSNGAAATVGWDYCTGVGSPRGKLGK